MPCRRSESLETDPKPLRSASKRFWGESSQKQPPVRERKGTGRWRDRIVMWWQVAKAAEPIALRLSLASGCGQVASGPGHHPGPGQFPGKDWWGGGVERSTFKVLAGKPV